MSIVKRELHQLKAQTWVARVLVIDQPGPGEDYLTQEQIQAFLVANRGYEQGLETKVDSAQG
jgi:hypothetical protein